MGAANKRCNLGNQQLFTVFNCVPYPFKYCWVDKEKNSKSHFPKTKRSSQGKIPSTKHRLMIPMSYHWATSPYRHSFVACLMAGVACKQRQSGSKTILHTGSPYKKLLEKKKQKKGKALLKRKSSKVQCKRYPINTFIVCSELISKSRSREKWILCVVCKEWAHLDCTLNDGKKKKKN